MAIPGALENLGQEFVEVHVGKKLKMFVGHKKLICAKSEYFKKAFTSGFIESEGVMFMPEDTSGTFALFVEWLYRDTIRDCDSPQAFFNLHNFYIFAEKICEQHLTNLISDAIRGALYTHIPAFAPALTAYVYSRTAEKSPLRQLCLRSLVYSLWARDDDRTLRNRMPSRKGLESLFPFLAKEKDLFVDYFEATKYSQSLEVRDLAEHPSDITGCAFHSHATGEDCYLQDEETVHIVYWVLPFDTETETIEKYMESE
ncbi:hypothetical protein QTJ16_002935 [Diplocarpon rosae]|uniref:BTB domain-containing protein n=1 Tax=Diplocarpon rosae TaxID=946125 RepID=A0AAD9T3W4_9HELO|nr:hypothetical protein QTJ16_002935 [Diplocarpon rosae]